MRFIHFGCWNRGTCTDDGNNAISSVMRELKTYVDVSNKDKDINKHINFMIIAGDNYYANKTIDEDGKKIKTLKTRWKGAKLRNRPSDQGEKVAGVTF